MKHLPKSRQSGVKPLAKKKFEAPAETAPDFKVWQEIELLRQTKREAMDAKARAELDSTKESVQKEELVLADLRKQIIDLDEIFGRISEAQAQEQALMLSIASLEARDNVLSTQIELDEEYKDKLTQKDI